jgi:hypothetical protein
LVFAPARKSHAAGTHRCSTIQPMETGIIRADLPFYSHKPIQIHLSKQLARTQSTPFWGARSRRQTGFFMDGRLQPAGAFTQPPTRRSPYAR